MYYVSRIFGALAVIALGASIWFSIVLARADFYFRAATPASVARAVEIDPRHTEYLALRALQMDYDGVDSTALTKRIAGLSPLGSAPRLKLGLAAEVNGDERQAERWLLEAAGVDHQFEPRWTLANFYFRAGNLEEFWKWMRAALDVSYGDRTPAFDLCWRVSEDAEEILRRAIPDRHEVTGAYLVYVSTAKHVDAIAGAARKLAAYHDPSDLPLLYGACDQLLAAGDPEASEVWALTGHPKPAGIVNGDFASPPLNQGFDWRFIPSTGVTHIILNAPAGVRVILNGQEPEVCTLLTQTLSVPAGKKVWIHWEARTNGFKSPSGLAWMIGGSQEAVAASADWTAGELSFTVTNLFSVLELAYRRPAGEPRVEGSVELRRVWASEAAP